MNNLKIAHVHSQNRKLVAYCVAKASLLAVIMNGLVVPAGLVCILIFAHVAWPLIGLSSIVLIPLGIMLAITVDGMTLGACARLRRTFERRIAIKNHYASIEKIEPEVVDEAEKRELNALRSSYILNGIFIVLFTAISASAGWLLWHTLLQWINGFPEWLSISLSILFAASVSVTLIASELLKHQNEEIVTESIAATHFHKAAFKADAEEKALKILAAKYDTQVSEMEESPMLTTVAYEGVQSIYNDVLFDGENLIQQRIEADNVARERAEQKRLDRVRQQQELLAGKSISSEGERDTGPLQKISSPKFRKLGNAEKVAQVVDKYGEPYIRQNIEAISTEIGMHKTTIYGHLKQLKEG